MQQASRTAAQWAAQNPTLLRGEIGQESDTYRHKSGDGFTPWSRLPYISHHMRSLARRVAYVQKNPIVATLTTVGALLTTTGAPTLTNQDADDGAWAGVSQATGTVQGWSFVGQRIPWGVDIVGVIKTGAASPSVGQCIGLGPIDLGDPASGSFDGYRLGFQAGAGAPGASTSIYLVGSNVSDTGAVTWISTGVAWAANTPYVLRLRITTDFVQAFVNNCLVATQTADLTDPTVGGLPAFYLSAHSGTAVVSRFGRLLVETGPG